MIWVVAKDQKMMMLIVNLFIKFHTKYIYVGRTIGKCAFDADVNSEGPDQPVHPQSDQGLHST